MWGSSRPAAAQAVGGPCPETPTPSREEPALIPRRHRRGSPGISKTRLIKQQFDGGFVDTHYTTVGEVGNGSFGSVGLVRDCKGQLRVCKRVDTTDMPRPLIELMRKEIGLLRTLDHPYIVRLYEFAEDAHRRQLTLILEYVSGGDCDTLLRKSRKGLKESVTARLIHQLLVALAYCHARKIIHRDVKPENMMLEYKSNSMWCEPDCKVIDFGVGEMNRHRMNDLVGTPAYMAPEVVASRHNEACQYTSQADVWSVGVTTLELLTGRTPFGKPEDYGSKMEPIFERCGVFQSFKTLEPRLSGSTWPRLTDKARNFVMRLMQSHPSLRPTASRAVRDCWLDGHKAVNARLTSRMVRGMAAFTESGPVVRCCLLIIASRSGARPEDAKEIGPAFLAMDVDGDGVVSPEELHVAVTRATGFFDPLVDVEALFEATDADHNGRISYTEFTAACLHSSYSSMDQLMVDAFDALDTDRDDWVSMDDLVASFNQRSMPVLSKLPSSRPFDVDEWCKTLEVYAQESGFARMGIATTSPGYWPFKNFGCCTSETGACGKVCGKPGLSTCTGSSMYPGIDKDPFCTVRPFDDTGLADEPTWHSEAENDQGRSSHERPKHHDDASMHYKGRAAPLQL